MRAVIGLFGLTMMSFAAGTYFIAIKTGICAAVFVFGAGLLIDAVKK